MRKIYKYITHACSNLDVSPITPGGFSKELIIIFWGINAVVFLANGMTCDFVKNRFEDGTTVCIETKKISKADFYTEEFQLVNTSQYIVIYSFNAEVPEYDVIIIPSGRSPPVKFKI
jgi:hypothetical protein